jgi:hypothetical protein
VKQERAKVIGLIKLWRASNALAVVERYDEKQRTRTGNSSKSPRQPKTWMTLDFGLRDLSGASGARKEQKPALVGSGRTAS